MLNNYNSYLLPNSLIPPINNQIPNQTLPPITQSLCLNQIENYEPIKTFKDSSNTEWILTKASTDSTLDIPDPKGIQIISYWNHEFPNIRTKLYVYVVEGIRQPLFIHF